MISILKITMGNNSAKNVGGVTVVEVIERTRYLYRKFQRGIILQKM